MDQLGLGLFNRFSRVAIMDLQKIQQIKDRVLQNWALEQQVEAEGDERFCC